MTASDKCEIRMRLAWPDAKFADGSLADLLTKDIEGLPND